MVIVLQVNGMKNRTGKLVTSNCPEIVSMALLHV